MAGSLRFPELPQTVLHSQSQSICRIPAWLSTRISVVKPESGGEMEEGWLVRSEPIRSRHWGYESPRSDLPLQQHPCRRLHGISHGQITNSAFVGALGLDAANL